MTAVEVVDAPDVSVITLSVGAPLFNVNFDPSFFCPSAFSMAGLEGANHA